MSSAVVLKLSWAEARAVVAERVEPLPAHSVPLKDCLGRILATDMLALAPMPHYTSAAMDGWAVAGSPPWILVEAGERIAAGQAGPVVTGGVLPPGAKAVLRSEAAMVATDAEGLPVLALSGAARPGDPKSGAHIRKVGEEAAAGDLLVKAGTTLNPAHLALAALAGHDELTALGRPVARLAYTGDEVVSSGVPGPGQVRDVFSIQMGHVIESLGAEVASEQHIPDSLAATIAALEETENDAADVVITTGGTGVSEVDFLRPAIAALGGRLVVDGIAMRPGHPTLLAELPDRRYILGLPGNPLAAMMGLMTLGAPLLAKLGSLPAPAVFEVVCGATVPPSDGPTRLMPYRLVYGLASPATHTGSAMLRGLADADGVMVVPPHGVRMGDTAVAFVLPWVHQS